jgi:hypothetical protein
LNIRPPFEKVISGFSKKVLIYGMRVRDSSKLPK